MSGWKRLGRDLGLILLAFVVYFSVPLGDDIWLGALPRGLLSILAIVAVGAIVLWQVLRQVDDPGRRVDGLVLSMLCGVLIFALAFFRLQVEDPLQFDGLRTRLDALYFTVTTLLTVGYGDIHAEGQIARGLVLSQMVFNIVVLATAATTLNNRVRENARRRASRRAGNPPRTAPSRGADLTARHLEMCVRRPASATSLVPCHRLPLPPNAPGPTASPSSPALP